MSRDFTVVYCDLKDCLYYNPEPGFPRKCRCVHPDKLSVMNMEKCPLYQLNWQKQVGALNEPPQKPTVYAPSKKKVIKKYGMDDE